MKKQIITLTLTTALAAIALSACGSKASNNSNQEAASTTTGISDSDDNKIVETDFETMVSEITVGLISGWTDITPEEIGVSDVLMEETLTSVGYTKYDLNDDGYTDFIIGDLPTADAPVNPIYNFFIGQSGGNSLSIFNGGERDYLTLCNDGYYMETASESAFKTTYTYYTLDSTGLVEIESLVYDSSTDSENPWTYTKKGEKAKTFTEDEATELMAKYVGRSCNMDAFNTIVEDVSE